jgi:hypothetical protein
MKGSSGMEKKIEVVLIKENEDGSADYMFNLPPESVKTFARLGIMTAIQAGLDGAKRYEPDNEEVPPMDANIKRLAIEAGFIAWDEEEWKPEGIVFDWASADDESLVNFYRLVVRECANIAYEVGLHRQTKHEILRRFGLEVTDED